MTKRCEPCRSFNDRVDAVYGAGGHAEIETLEVVRVTQQAIGIHEYLVVRQVSETRPGALSSPASATESCSTKVGWESADRECKWSWQDYQGSAGDGAVWTVQGICENGGIHASYLECEENGERSILSDVFRDGVDVGDVWMPDKDAHKVDPGRAAIRFFEDFD